MNEAWEAISRLPADARVRVIRYLAGRASLDETGRVGNRGAGGTGASGEIQAELNFYDKPSAGAGTEQDMADRLRALFADRPIGTTANKILVAAAMIQEAAGGRPVSAREINEPLRKAGVSVSNISAHLNAIHERSGRKAIVKVTEKNRHHRYQVTATGQRHADQIMGESRS